LCPRVYDANAAYDAGESAGHRRGHLALARHSHVIDDLELAAVAASEAVLRHAGGPPSGRLVALASVALARVAPFERVVREGAGADEEIAALARDLLEWRRATAARMVDVLAGEDGLRPGLTREEAADLLFALGGPEVHHLLVGVRGWSQERFDAHVADLLSRLIGPTPPKKALSSRRAPLQRSDP
jgi:hypothetical protein